MDLFKFVQVSALVAAMLVSSTQLHAISAPVKTSDSGEMPTLLKVSKQKNATQVKEEVPANKTKELDASIAKVNLIAKNLKDNASKKVLQKAVAAAKDASRAVKTENDVKNNAKKATKAVDKALEKLGYQARGGCRSSCSSSTEDSLWKLKKAISNCCCEIQGKIQELSDALLCSQRIVIDDLPFIIVKSGSYCIASDLTSASASPAIEVRADNVDIDLGGHVITVGTNTQAIFAEGITRLTVHNGTFQTAEPAARADTNSLGTLLIGDTNVSFTDVTFFNFRRGALADTTNDLQFANCKFDQAEFDGNNNTGILTELCDYVAVDGCEFSDKVFRGVQLGGSSNIGIHNCKISGPLTEGAIAIFAVNGGLAITDEPCQSLQITDCQFKTQGVALGSGNSVNGVEGALIRNCVFASQEGPALLVQSGNGILIENCIVTASELNSFNLFQAAVLDPAATVKDITVRNSIFNQETTVQDGFDTVFLSACEGVVLENCTIDASPAAAEFDGSTYFGANIHIDQGPLLGSFPTPVTKNVRVINSLIRNQASIGVFADLSIVNDEDAAGSLVIELNNCQIDGAEFDGIRFDNVKSSLVKNCSITNTVDGNGISLLNSSQFNTLINNTVSKNSVDGIYNTDVTNEFYNNSSCNNVNNDCVDVNAAVVPGAPYVAGANICCNF